MTGPSSPVSSTGPAADRQRSAAENQTQFAAAARAFEAVMLRQMIGSMRQASAGEDILGSSASEQFRDMSDARLADQMAGSFGIARLLVAQLGKAGEAE